MFCRHKDLKLFFCILYRPTREFLSYVQATCAIFSRPIYFQQATCMCDGSARNPILKLSTKFCSESGFSGQKHSTKSSYSIVQNETKDSDWFTTLLAVNVWLYRSLIWRRWRQLQLFLANTYSEHSTSKRKCTCTDHCILATHSRSFPIAVRFYQRQCHPLFGLELGNTQGSIQP